MRLSNNQLWSSHCERSEAISPANSREKKRDCFVAPLLAMTSDYGLFSLDGLGRSTTRLLESVGRLQQPATVGLSLPA
jgi:hypothetical protein